MLTMGPFIDTPANLSFRSALRRLYEALKDDKAFQNLLPLFSALFDGTENPSL
jgi:hypothetical protein